MGRARNALFVLTRGISDSLDGRHRRLVVRLYLYLEIINGDLSTRMVVWKVLQHSIGHGLELLPVHGKPAGRRVTIIVGNTRLRAIIFHLPFFTVFNFRKTRRSSRLWFQFQSSPLA